METLLLILLCLLFVALLFYFLYMQIIYLPLNRKFIKHLTINRDLYKEQRDLLKQIIEIKEPNYFK